MISTIKTERNTSGSLNELIFFMCLFKSSPQDILWMLSTDGDTHGPTSISSNSFKYSTQIMPQIHLMSVAFSLMKTQMPLLFIIVCVPVQKLASLTAIEITPDAEAKYLIVFIVARKQRSNIQGTFPLRTFKKERKNSSLIIVSVKLFGMYTI